MPRLHRLCVDAPLAFLHGQPGAGCEGDGHAASFTPSQPSGLHRRHVPVTAFAKDATAAAKDTTAAAKEGEDAKKEGKEGEEEEDPLVTRKPHDTADAVDIYIHNKMGLMFGGGNINKVYDLIDESRKLNHEINVKLRKLKAHDIKADAGASAAVAEAIAGGGPKAEKVDATSALQLSAVLPSRGGKASRAFASFLPSAAALVGGVSG
eukprot:TRINITY_DN36392_c0_g1_i1.p1 TRINITY_DN36392_c0_g1~~TRINITY_DN36392_c0_g1_i1.p1  ORF type:complete len:218 (+),score=56.97 TRINITY_DN36392_c0_g1_i1:32-655(+)